MNNAKQQQIEALQTNHKIQSQFLARAYIAAPITLLFMNFIGLFLFAMPLLGNILSFAGILCGVYSLMLVYFSSVLSQRVIELKIKLLQSDYFHSYPVEQVNKRMVQNFKGMKVAIYCSLACFLLSILCLLLQEEGIIYIYLQVFRVYSYLIHNNLLINILALTAVWGILNNFKLIKSKILKINTFKALAKKVFKKVLKLK